MKQKPKILIVGAGLSGLMAALKVADQGVEVRVVCLDDPLRSDTARSKGGLAVMSEKGEVVANVDKHFEETVLASDYLVDQKAVRSMCEQGVDLFHLLTRLGVEFDRTCEGYLKFHEVAGARSLQAVSSGANTGRVLQAHLISQIRSRSSISIETGWEFLSLVYDYQGCCQGIVAQHRQSMEIQSFRADAVVMATGGAAGVLGRSCQASLAQAATMGALFEQGVHLANLEFFHYTPAAIKGPDGFVDVASPLLRAGGRFWVANKENSHWYFLEELYPKFGKRLPYLVASRAITKITSRGMGIKGQDLVYLDVSHLDNHDGRELAQTLTCIQHVLNIDGREHPIPVTPAVNYSLGGLWVDENQQTNLRGVFASGECQFQFHGANGLEDNFFLASLYSGGKAAEAAVHYVLGLETRVGENKSSLYEDEKNKHIQNHTALLKLSGKENVYQLVAKLQKTMDGCLMVERDNQALKNAEMMIDELTERFNSIGLSDTSSWANQEVASARHFKHSLSLARVMVTSAYLRNESRGCHYKLEFPKRDDQNFLKLSRAQYAASGPQIDYQDIQMENLKP